MKAYKVEILIIDHDNVGVAGIIDVLQDSHYPNRCINPRVQSIQSRDIGEWTDEHPLNKRSTADAAYRELFTTYDTSQGRCGLCGSSTCSGTCFK